MHAFQNRKPIGLSGRWQYQLRSLIALYRSMLSVSIRRALRGPRLPRWSWSLESSLHFLKTQTSTAFDIADMPASREYDDSLVFHSPAFKKVRVEPVENPVKGHWVYPDPVDSPTTILYFHGGGYAYYSKAHYNLIALVTLTAKSRAFALDYRLIPEHPFPAQLEDALAAYQWIIGTGVQPRRVMIAGDSAGGNLCLALLLALREKGFPLPTAAICISPWTDVSNPGSSMSANEPTDWVEKRMPERWATWFCRGADARNPLISPIQADLTGLPPIYIQAGSAEILYDMIQSFADCAQKQGANVILDVWPDMPHDFQAFGEMLPESREALARIGEFMRKFAGEIDQA